MSNDNSERIRAKMLKLLALARRGEGGEKENAQRFLERMLRQHGMSMEDLDDDAEPKQWREFSYKNQLEERLLLQIVCTALNVSEVSCKQDKRGKKIAHELTRSQHLEISLQFSILRTELAKSVDNMFLAFVYKNHIEGPSSNSEGSGESSLSKEDLEAIIGMMGGIKRAKIHKALEMNGGAT